MAACDTVFPERVQVCGIFPWKALSESSGLRDPLVYVQQDVVGVSRKEKKKAQTKINESKKQNWKVFVSKYEMFHKVDKERGSVVKV